MRILTISPFSPADMGLTEEWLLALDAATSEVGLDWATVDLTSTLHRLPITSPTDLPALPSASASAPEESAWPDLPLLLDTATFPAGPPFGALAMAQPATTGAGMPEGVIGTATSNDEYFSNSALWGMQGDTAAPTNSFGSQAAEAWAAGYVGSTTTVVGLIDTGLDYTHPDLYLNVWLNQREIPSAMRAQLRDIDGDTLITFRDLNNALNAAFVSDINGNSYIDAGDLLNDNRWENAVDDDSNGFRDDLIGWDFVNNDNNPLDDNGHGSHVAGTIGAIGGNGIGVAGINWAIQIVAIKTLNASNSGTNPNAASGIDYFTGLSRLAAPAERFVATNNSYAATGSVTAIGNAINRAAQANILTVVAAGNNGSNNNTTASFPGNFSTTAAAGYDAVVAVASIDIAGNLASNSNFGSTTVDLGAPGVNILSLMPLSQATGGAVPYISFSGTSMATPHVTGALALLASENPNATAAQLKAALLATTDATASLEGRTVTGGRLDVSGLLESTTATPSAGTAGNDSIVGGTAGNALVGAAGDDSLDGRGGNDTLTGAEGNDTLIGGNGADRLDGGEGRDLVSYAGATDGVSVDLATGTTAEGDTLVGIENLLGSLFADTLLGAAAEERLVGGGGADLIDGGLGNDTLVGGVGADSLAGGLGLDLLDYGAATAGVTLSLASGLGSGGEAAGDSLAGFEIVQGSAFGDSLQGGTGAETLFGGNGNDQLQGGGGDDRLEGGSGTDTIVFLGNRDQTTIIANFDGSLSIAGPDGNDLAIGVETAQFSDGSVAVPGAAVLSLGLTTDTGTAGDRITQLTPLSGTGRALTSLTLSGAVNATTTTDQAGRWSFSPVGLADGTYSILATQIDAVGGARSASLSFTLDTVAPLAPALALLPSSDSGLSNSDRLTNDTTPDFSGTTEAGSTVRLFRNGVSVGNATVSGETWTFSSAALSSGIYSFTAQSVDVAGNVSPLSSGVVVTVDATPPTAPGISLRPESDTGLSSSDRITAVSTPTIAGTVEEGSSVAIFRGGMAIGAATVTGTSWSFTSATLTDGVYAFTARATDAAGNISATSSALNVTIDRAAPPAPGIALSAASDTGSSNSDRLTNNQRPTITGTAEAGSLVEVALGGTTLGFATLTGTTWTYTYAGTPLSDGVYDFSAAVTDLAGNRSASATVQVTVDATAPPAPTLSLLASSDSGISNTDRITNDATPDFTGTTEAGHTVQILRNGVVVGTATVNGTSWSYTSPSLGNGTYAFTARSVDTAGNISPASASVTLEVDVSAPTVPSIQSISSDTGLSTADQITSDTTPELIGSAEAGSRVSVFRNGVDVGLATVTGTTWRFTSAALADGVAAFTVRATDTAGNLSALSSPLNVTIDTSAPAAAIITGAALTASDGSLLSASGTAEARSRVELRAGDRALGSTLTDASGRWSLTTTATLDIGTYQLRAITTDIAGNVGPGSAPLLLTVGVGAAGLAGAPSLAGFDGTDTLNGSAAPDTIIGGDGNDVMVGSDGADSLSGDGGNDLFYGGAENDSVSGGLGADIMEGNGGDDRLAGGDGVDVLVSGEGNDTLSGDAGDDLLYGGLGADSLAGGDGRDALEGNEGGDTLSGGNDGDVLVGGDGNDRLAGDASDDILYAGAGDDTLLGGDGADQLSGDGGNDSLEGGNQADILVGGDGRDLLSGDAGNDLLYGGEGNDTLLGGDGDDQLSGEGGLDSLNGGAGNDVLVGRFERATLNGGAGDDYLASGTGDVIMLGGDGNDMLISTGGANSLDGGANDDVFAGGAGFETMIGGAGNDYIIANGGDDSALGDAGNDQLFGEDGNDSLSGGLGDDLILGGNGRDRLAGDDGQDYLVASAGEDSVAGGAGNDQIFGGDGADTLSGGANADNLLGEGGDDLLLGDDGDDYMVAGAGSDTLSGGSGNDQLFASEGADSLDGGDGDDGLNGGSDNNRIAGGRGADYIQAGGGRDTVDGGDANDNVFGDTGDDSLLGGAGDDVVVGGEGADTVAGGSGGDYMIGGAGVDLFLWQQPETSGDFVADFARGEDRLGFSAAGFGGGLVAGEDLSATGRFAVNAAAGTQAQFVYQVANGALYWDADGADAGGAALLVVIGGAPAITAADLQIIA